MSIKFADLFCGAGGSSTGLEEAGWELVAATTHSKIAIATHAVKLTELPGRVCAGDDAAAAAWVNVEDALADLLAFDRGDILADAFSLPLDDQL